ncbi:DUF5801 repeats-in-toxin domain-containing protein [Pseudomonas sp. DP-17]|uniref:DUF5801 repeats-in-toxin domain-containing protein n=1 Tax=Pseudomonas sp. DP-17 TaxID=1580486 RepID=UPI001EFB8F31|nr:DUF5801 repeats-in-toxin domain-containing protein [Pseudomonas sp. DP-17]MCG8910373.1 DUF5801 domain-containing protein [Pseudomonas sp. DP-17]
MTIHKKIASPTRPTADDSTAPSVTTDQNDYAPGSTAIITASGFTAGSTVKIEVDHATSPGADGVWGTPDDVLNTSAGAGHDPWYVTDGGAGDLDGLVNGSVTTSWYVDPDDSAGARFLLSASSDGATATATFTDAGPIVSATGVTVSLDETTGLQNATATPSPAGDADDNDILLASLPAAFTARLTALGAGTASGAALSGYTGAAGNTGSNAFTISAAPGGAITDILFTGSGGAPLNGLDSGLDTLAGVDILLYTDTTNNNVLLGRAGGANGTIVFAAYIEETGSPVSGGKIWTVEYQPLKHPDGTNADDALNLLNKVYIGTSQDLTFSLADAPSGQNLFLMFTTATPTTVNDNGVIRITDPTIIATGKDPANQSTGANITTGDTINTSQAGGPTTFGTNNQMIVEQEGIRFTFVTGARQDMTIPNLDQNEADVEANIDFTQMFNAKTASFDVVQLQSGKSAIVKISAFSTAAEAGNAFIDGYAGDTTVAITNVRVLNSTTGAVLENSNGSVNDPGIVITITGGVATITGVLAGYKIEYTTTADHNRVLIENGAAVDAKGNDHADFDIGGFKLLQVSTATVEIGSKMIFEDDGPSISTTGTEPTLTVDESALATDASQSFAANFSSAFGADGAGTLTYALSVIAGASGLVDTATGQAVNLSMNGAVVEGRTASSSDLVFTVSVAANGDVTLDQQRAIVHADTSNPDDSTTLTSDDLVKLTATKTDGDGDSAQATLNIGQNLIFKDDGPTVGTTGTEPTLTVDESDLITNASQSFAANFSPSYGADGAGANPVSYALGVVAGASGLTDTATGEAVNLSIVGGVVQGRTATTDLLVFSVSVDATGNVTLDQVRAIVHDDATNPDDSRSLLADSLVTLTATVTDKDGDSTQATLNIGQNLIFKDDGPTIGTTGTEPTLTVDESDFSTNATQNFAANFSPSYGADGAGATPVSYALSVIAGASGLIDTATGQAVNLSLNNGVVEGRTAISNALVFTVSAASNGDVTLDQLRAVVHENVTDPNDSRTLSADNLVKLVATATDKDGDTAQATLNIGQNLMFYDDGPSLAFGNIVGTGSTLAQTGYWDHSFGADGSSTAGLDIALANGQFTLVRPNGTTTTGTGTLTETSPSPDINGAYHFAGTLTGDFDNNASTANTSVDYTLTALADGTYTLDLVQGFSSTLVLSTANGSLGAGGPDPVQTLTIGTDAVVFFAAKALAPQTGANSILTGIGQGATDPTEAQLQTNPLPSYIDDQKALNVSTSGIGVKNNVLQGSGAGITAGDDSFVANPQTLLTSVKVFIDNSVGGYDPASESLYYVAYYDDGTTSGAPIKVLAGNLQNEAGGQKSFTVQTVAGKMIDAIQLTMAEGMIKIPTIQFIRQVENLASDVKLSFNATVTDGDGDTATSAFTANLFANKAAGGTFDYVLAGVTGTREAFNVDLARTENKYQVTGFDTAGQRDKLVLNGDATSTVQNIDNNGADSIVSIQESGGQITTITVVGVDILNTDIVHGSAT